MKKIFYILLGICMLSCSSSNDEAIEDTRDLQPDKSYEFYIDTPYSSSTSVNNGHYQFTYENGNLKTVFGLNEKSLPTNSISLSYQDNQVKVFDAVNNSTNAYTIHTIENNKLVKSEFYNFVSVLGKTRSYTYEKGIISVYEEKGGNQDAIITYYFNNDNNLVKQEKLERIGGANLGLNTIIYSDFDKAKNPFKKLGLVNDSWFAKSLSTNNFRKVEISYISFTNQDVSTKIYNCVYKYDSKGQVLLYHPL
ncbi:hypothetical protein [Chryseobacterium sp. SIMBA_028]|uniref:hypothetical protein n=2 Tax=Pseudomonadati TaxID=3379134 RepID=UPI003978F5DE